MGLFATTTGMQVKMVGTVFDTATTALASACIEDAENEIKKMLSGHYDISSAYFNTTTSIPPIIRTLALQLSEGYMYEAASRGSKEGYARADRYIKRVSENLMKLADGSLSLLDTAGSQILAINTKWQVHSNTTDYHSTFNEDSPKRWKIDQDKLEAIGDERGDTGNSNELD